HTPLRTLARQVPVVPSTLDGDEVMERVRADGMQVALVVDEYGGTAGIITMEDLIEEIVGDVRDEHDEPEPDARQLDDGWSCSGLLRIDEIAGVTGYRAPDGDYETVGGLILTELGRIPDTGDEMLLPARPGTETERWLARVLVMDGHRIDRVLLTPVPPDSAEPDTAEPDTADAPADETGTDEHRIGDER
ncbi:transporter associated domain-containing protein, partial [Rhodococcus zopfii]